MKTDWKVGPTANRRLKNEITTDLPVRVRTQTGSEVEHPHPAPARRVATAGEAPAATLSISCQVRRLKGLLTQRQ